MTTQEKATVKKAMLDSATMAELLDTIEAAIPNRLKNKAVANVYDLQGKKGDIITLSNVLDEVFFKCVGGMR